MDLNRIALFVRTAEAASFTAAASALGLPKSSVSRHVAALEAELGTRLFQRTTRRLRLTAAGTAYYERAAQALNALEGASAALSEQRDQMQGRVRLTAPSDLAVALLAPLAARFLRQHPGIELEVSASARVINLVEEGFDLALRAGALRSDTLVARPLGLVHSGLFAARSYLRKRGEPASLSALAQHDTLHFRSSSGIAPWEFIGPAGAVPVKTSSRLTGDDFQFVQEACAAGQGIALLPLAYARSDTRLTRLLPQYASAGAPLHVVYPSARFVPRRVAQFRDFLLQELPPLLR